MPTKTRKDAHDRIGEALFGWRSRHPSEEYLTTLRSLVAHWLAEIDQDIYSLVINEEAKINDDVHVIGDTERDE